MKRLYCCGVPGTWLVIAGVVAPAPSILAPFGFALCLIGLTAIGSGPDA